jgi:FkbM family methyltransferase
LLIWAATGLDTLTPHRVRHHSTMVGSANQRNLFLGLVLVSLCTYIMLDSPQQQRPVWWEEGGDARERSLAAEAAEQKQKQKQKWAVKQRLMDKIATLKRAAAASSSLAGVSKGLTSSPRPPPPPPPPPAPSFDIPPPSELSRLPRNAVLFPGSPVGALPADPRDPNPHVQKARPGYYSQFGQDQWIVTNLFKWARHGVFLEAGARDGIDFSNTLFMEKQLGWTGVCVEPNPPLYAKLAAFTERKCVKVPHCLSDQPKTVGFLAYDSGLAGFAQGGDQARINAQLRERGIDRASITKQISCKTMTDVLLEAGITHINYISLDIEGAEMEALRGLDFDRIYVQSLMIENNRLASGDTTVKDFLATKVRQQAHTA